MDIIFKAISSKTRREIIELLAYGNRSQSDLAVNFEMSRQAVAKHLVILEVSGLVKVNHMGRETLYFLRREKLREVHTWIKGCISDNTPELTNKNE